MIPLLYLRMAGAAAIVAVLAGGYWYIDNKGYQRGKAEVQVKFDAYKENIDDQLSAAIIAKAKLEAEQNAKFYKAKLDYSDARGNLDSILDLLRKGSLMLRGNALPVAEVRTNPMPGKAADTSKLVVTPRTFSGTCGFDFYAAALRDNLRCQALIDFVKP